MSDYREIINEDIDIVLEIALPCDSKKALELALASHANATLWGEPNDLGLRDGQPLERLLWGLATRLREYKGPAHEGSRKRREGPASYTEQWLIQCGTSTDSLEAKHKRKGYPDAAYFAILFQRDAADAAKIYKAHGPAKNRTGFF